MKNIFERVILFFVVWNFLFIFNCTIVDAERTGLKDIKETSFMNIGEVSISSVSFVDNSNTSSQSFGLIGSIDNHYNEDVILVSTTYYYDSLNKLVAVSSNKQLLKGKQNSEYINMANFTLIKEDYQVSDIFYYEIDLKLIFNSNIEDVTPSKNSKYKSADYVIDSYDIQLIVHENNTIDITEVITAYFNQPRHGIYRIIPLKNTVNRLDGTSSFNRAQVFNVFVDNVYTTFREGDDYQIKIGSGDTLLEGEQRYKIKYTYNLLKDPMEDYDELYYNLIGNDWDAPIGNITFSITMPKEFDASKLGFSSGKLGAVDNKRIVYSVNDNTIVGFYHGILDIGESLTMRLELEEGYFRGAGFIINIKDYSFLLLPILFLLVTIILWYKYGRNDKVVETVEFYPPDGLNSLEVGFLYKGIAESQDVTSLLIYLASKGYIRILDGLPIDNTLKSYNIDDKTQQLSDKDLYEKANNPNSVKISKSSFTGFQSINQNIDFRQYSLGEDIMSRNALIFEKVKDYDGNNLNEKWFMEGLFKNGKSRVMLSDLYDSFYRTEDAILLNMNKKENKELIFEKSVWGKRMIWLMMIIIYVLITLLPFHYYDDKSLVIPSLLFPGIGFGLMLAMLLGAIKTIYFNGCATHSPFLIKFVGLFCGIVLGFLPWKYMLLPFLLKDFVYLVDYFGGIVCIIIMSLCLANFSKRTKYGMDILGKLKGFKSFLEIVEKEKLEALVMAKPSYFYDILPFSYVLGVSDKWIKKFEAISLQAPNWYVSSTDFDTRSFERFINRTMTSANYSMNSSSSSSSSNSSSRSSSSSSGSSSGGGSSGGGSSGGGSGGGGGRSW